MGILLVLLALLCAPSWTFASTDQLEAVHEAAEKLFRFCIDPGKTSLDERTLDVLADYVMGAKQTKEHAVPSLRDGTGAYFEFDTKITFPRFVEYSYSSLVPPVITRPSSLRYSIWTTPRGALKLPATWKRIPSGGSPVVVHGLEQESDTPDLNTHVYHEYDLKRTLILFNYKGHQAMLSISKQTGKSNVGKKGTILGNDNDWNYYYSGEPGTMTTGLGWVKSYIYDFCSIGIYVETGANSSMVRSGVFQWLRAGWSGINFVKSGHILAGLRRFSRDSRGSLESPRMPSPTQIASFYQSLSNMPPGELTERYTALQQAQRASAIQHGRISKSEGKERSFADVPKEQVLQELLLEYLKISLGKPALLGKQFLFPPAHVAPEETR